MGQFGKSCLYYQNHAHVAEDGVIKEHPWPAIDTPTQLKLLKKLGGPRHLIFMDAAVNVVRHGYGLLNCAGA